MNKEFNSSNTKLPLDMRKLFKRIETKIELLGGIIVDDDCQLSLLQNKFLNRYMKEDYKEMDIHAFYCDRNGVNIYAVNYESETVELITLLDPNNIKFD